MEKCFTEYLKKTISIQGTCVKKPMKESFYHGGLLGILGCQDTWYVSSDKESGEGYSDILIETGDGAIGIVIELKYAQSGNLEAGCKESLAQIEKNRYEEALYEEGIEHILKYEIACYKKCCKVVFRRSEIV